MPKKIVHLSIQYPLVEVAQNHIYVGTSGTAKDTDLLDKHGIKWRLCVAEEVFRSEDNEDKNHVLVPISENSLLIEDALSVLQDREASNEKILIYGSFSRSRALVPIIAYTMYKSKLNFDAAFKEIVSKWLTGDALAPRYRTQLKELWRCGRCT